MSFTAQAQFSSFLKPPSTAEEKAESSQAPGGTSYATLADLLEDDAARATLIEQLRALAAGQAPADGAATEGVTSAPATAPAEDAAADAAAARTEAAAQAKRDAEPDLTDRIANEAQQFVEDLVAGASVAVATFRALATGDAANFTRLAGWPTALLHMLMVAVATILAFLVLRSIAGRIYRRMDQWVLQHQLRVRAIWHPQDASPPGPAHLTKEQAAAYAGGLAAGDTVDLHGPPAPHPPPLHMQMQLLYGKAVAVVGGLVIDVLVILLAAAAGYGVALFFTGPRGVLGTFEHLFLNAFVAVEIARSLVRMVFASHYQHLRLLPMEDDLADYWNAWLERVTSIAGYGVLLVVPLVAAVFSTAVGQMFSLLIMLGVYIYAVRIIWKNRVGIRARLINRARLSSTAFFGTLLRMLARTWHLLAIAYFTVLLVVTQVDPAGSLPYMMHGTLQSALAIGVGLALSAALTALLSRRITLSNDMRARLPMLESRLNSYVPAALRGIRLFILVTVTLFVLDAWRVFSLSAWIASDSGSAAIATVVRVAIILLFAALIWTVVASIIEHRLARDEGQGAPSARERTLLSLFRNATLIVIVTMTVLVVLSQIGIDIGPLIAGAGVVGLAIGFGAQKLVQDVINGIFIQLENGMNQNDVVEAGGVFGTVEKITIRSVGIRTLDGGYHMIPFSSVDKVTNHMRDFSYHLGEYTVAHRESVDDAAFHLERAFQELMTDPVLAPEIMEDITIAGVTSLNERGFTIRVLIKTKPGMQWAVQRGYNRLVKKHFNAAGIELPYPHTVVYFGQDKNGFAPAANVHTIEERATVRGTAIPAGNTPRPLHHERSDVSRSSDVLGNEMATVVSEDGEVTTQAGTTAGRDAQEERQEEDGKSKV
nr:mechanosensitive ion channel [Pseudomonas sp.]